MIKKKKDVSFENLVIWVEGQRGGEFAYVINHDCFWQQRGGRQKGETGHLSIGRDSGGFLSKYLSWGFTYILITIRGVTLCHSKTNNLSKKAEKIVTVEVTLQVTNSLGCSSCVSTEITFSFGNICTETHIHCTYMDAEPSAVTMSVLHEPGDEICFCYTLQGFNLCTRDRQFNIEDEEHCHPNIKVITTQWPGFTQKQLIHHLYLYSL